MARAERGPSRVAGYLGGAVEIVQFLWARKLWWMVPVVLALLVLALLVFVAGATPASPFIYTLF